MEVASDIRIDVDSPRWNRAADDPPLHDLVQAAEPPDPANKAGSNFRGSHG